MSFARNSFEFQCNTTNNMPEVKLRDTRFSEPENAEVVAEPAIVMEPVKMSSNRFK